MSSSVRLLLMTLIFLSSSCIYISKYLEHSLSKLEIGETFEVYHDRPRMEGTVSPVTELVYGAKEKKCFENFDSPWDVAQTDTVIYLMSKDKPVYLSLKFYKGRLKYIRTMRFKEGYSTLQDESRLFELNCNLASINSLI